MLFVFIFMIIFTIIGGILWRPAITALSRADGSHEKRGSYGDKVLKDRYVTANVLLGFAAFFLFFSIVHVGTINNNQVSDLAQIHRTEKDQKVVAEYRDKLKGTIQASIAQYPEFEKSIISEIDPVIILAYPNLKSNETLMAQFNAYIEADQRYAANQGNINKLEAKIETRQNNHITNLTFFLWNQQ